jgi:hypothetical protein
MEVGEVAARGETPGVAVDSDRVAAEAKAPEGSETEAAAEPAAEAEAVVATVVVVWAAAA